MRTRPFFSPAALGALTLGALTLAACGGNDTPAAPADTPTAAEAPAAPAPAAPAPSGATADVTITPVGDEMKYAETEFTVAPGQTVRLTFRNTATSPAMSHNVVILQPGADANAVGQAALSAADNGYIPAAMADQILAHTPLSAPGQTVEVTFTAPAAGDYPYLCTFAGHYAMMRGTMHVVANPS